MNRPSHDKTTPWLWAILGILLLAPFLVLPGAAEAAGESEWHVLVEDAELDARYESTPGVAKDPRVDLVEVAVKERPDEIVVRLTTRDGPNPDPLFPETNNHMSVFGFEYTRKADGALGIFTLEFFDDRCAWLMGKGDGASTNLSCDDEDLPWDYVLEVPKADLFGDHDYGAGDVIAETYATIESAGDGVDRGYDRAPDTGVGTGMNMTLAPDPNGTTGAQEPRPEWYQAEGPDYAAGPDVASGPDGTVHVSYMVYNGDRGTKTGLYHGLVLGNSQLDTTRVDDVTFPSDLHEDGATRTALAVDASGEPHIVYHPEPGGSGADLVRYATRADGGWVIEDPASAVSGGAQVDVDDSDRAYPDIAVRDGRIVVAIQGHEDVTILERTGPDTWVVEETIGNARHARIAIDAEGRYHVAWFAKTFSVREVHDGELRYLKESGDSRVITEDLEDYSSFWEGRGTNGGFGFALGPDDTPHFVFEDGRSPQRYAELRQDGLHTEPFDMEGQTENPYNTMEMAVDADGFAHVVGGYGKVYGYSMRAPDGGWYHEERERTDVFAMTATPDGRVQIVGTQPHGGTTLEWTGTSSRGLPGDPVYPQESVFNALPGPGPLLVVAALGGLFVAATMGGARTVADRRPGYALPFFAAVGGFSRLKKDKMTEHATRDEIVTAIQAAPGRTAAEVRRDLGIPRSTFFYHLRRLEEEGLLKATREGGRMWLYPPDIARPPQPRPPAFDREETLLEVARKNPGMTAREYAEILGWNPRTVHDYLSRLERVEAMQRFRVHAREVRWYVQPEPGLGEAG